MFGRLFRNIQEIPVTFGLITIHMIIYGMLWSQDSGFGALFANPNGTGVLESFGAQVNPLVWDGDYYRLFLCGLLHGSLLHLLMNNAALLVLGRLLEQLMGSVNFVVLYIFSLYAGSLASLIWTAPYAVSVGSSGAIMGLAGGLMVFLLLDHKNRFVVATPFGKIFFLILILFNLFIGEWIEIINSTAHLGGFVVGVAFTLFFWSRIPDVALPRIVGTTILSLCIAGLIFFTYKGLTPQGSNMWHVHLGWQAFQKGDAKTAEHHFEIALKDHTDRHILLRLAMLYEQTHQWKKVTKIYANLVKKRPQSLILWQQWISALGEINDRKTARLAYQKVQKRFKKELTNENIRLMFLVALRREKEAILAYQKLLDLLPEHPNLNNSLAWLLVTAHQSKYRNPKLAYKYATIAVQQTKYKVSAYIDTLAEVLFQLKRYKEAIICENKALQAPDSQIHMMHLHKQLKKFQAAQNLKLKTLKNKNVMKMKKINEHLKNKKHKKKKQ